MTKIPAKKRLRTDPLAVAEWCPTVAKHGKWIFDDRNWEIPEETTNSNHAMRIVGCRIGLGQEFDNAVWVRWGGTSKCFIDPEKLSRFIDSVVG